MILVEVAEEAVQLFSSTAVGSGVDHLQGLPLWWWKLTLLEQKIQQSLLAFDALFLAIQLVDELILREPLSVRAPCSYLLRLGGLVTIAVVVTFGGAIVLRGPLM